MLQKKFPFTQNNLQQWIRLAPKALMALCLLGTIPKVALAQATSQTGAQTTAQNVENPQLNVGIVQRFGTDPTDQITLKALQGDRLTLRFETGGQPQMLRTDSVKLEVGMQALPDPVLDERVVFSTHRSFESAEDSANQWRARGIEVEIAQPGQWQVWAKRDVYSTPFLRRLLLESLEAQNIRTAFLDTNVKQQVPKAAFVVGAYRYSRDRLEITSGNSRIQISEGPNNQNSQLYAGSLRLQPNVYGTYTLVNQVPIETYLRGVVPHEIGTGAPQTTIEAQAILARTYALRNLRRFAVDGYELCADTQCQVYQGLSGAAPNTDQAIAATRGKVLTYQNELVDALYSSTTGGITAPFSDVWNGPNRPYLQAVVDSVQNVWDLSRYSLEDETNFRNFISRRQGFNEEGWDQFRWRRESELVDITSLLKRYLQNNQHPLGNFTTIQQIQVTERSPAGRALQVAVQTDVGVVELEKDEILRALPPRSTLFYIEPIYKEDRNNPNNSQVRQAQPGQNSNQNTQTAQNSQTSPPKTLWGFAFVGGGLGHGVGLSQTGSYRLGRLGWSSDRILSFYYPGTQLQPISSNIIFWRPESTTRRETTLTQPQSQPAPASGSAPIDFGNPSTTAP